MKNPLDDLRYLKSIQDDDIDLSYVALLLAALRQPDLPLERFENHLKKLSRNLAACHSDLLEQGELDCAALRLRALQTVFVEQEGYRGDREGYDDLENASLIRVIERRKGLPITLSILCLHMMRGVGWDAYGLNVPGHFLCRLDMDGARVIFDPFEDCRELKAHDLRALVKRAQGAEAELSADLYAPATNRDILIRLQNNIKFRQIEHEDYVGALETLEAMRLIAPDEYRLLLEVGVLNAKVGYPAAAIDALEAYVACAPNPFDRDEAQRLLYDLRMSLN